MLDQQLPPRTLLCEISYRPRYQALFAFQELGWNPIALHPIGHWSELYLLLSAQRAVIVVTGSNQIRDWTRRNFWASLYEVPDLGRVHKGFWFGAKSDWNRLRPTLEALQASQQLPYHIEIVGHSLGAAIAQLLAVHAAKYFPMVYMFGAPRVGDAEFCDRYIKLPGSCWNVRNPLDPVPRVPCRAMGYKHAGIQVVWDGATVRLGRQPWEQTMGEMGPGEMLLHTLRGKGTITHSSYGFLSKN